jgi:hypothetical protein
MKDTNTYPSKHIFIAGETVMQHTLKVVRWLDRAKQPTDPDRGTRRVQMANPQQLPADLRLRYSCAPA